MALPLGIPLETWAIILIAFLIFYGSIRVRKYMEYLKTTGGQGFGASLIIIGAILFALVYFKLNDFLSTDTELLTKISMWLLIIGVAAVILDYLYQNSLKRQLTGLEEERREYITRVRKGIKLEEAEKIALETLRRATRKKDLQIVASEKEFKTWIIFAKDKFGSAYKVVLDIEGEVKDWEAVDELPSYMQGPF